MGPATALYTTQVVDAQGTVIADVHGATMRQQTRIAHLLIAAPRLVAAAQSIADHLEAGGVMAADEPFLDALHTALEDANWGAARATQG